jgi:dipeptidyl aminopeptidase/acylaminoacyl peptidase
MRRRIAIGSLLVILLGAGAAAAQQVPLIDRNLFFGDPEIAGAQISHDGQYITFIKPYRGVLNIWLKERDAPFDAARPMTADTTRPVTGYFWSQDSRLILYVQDKGGNENFHVYAVDPQAQPEEATGVPPARDLTPYEGTRAMIYAVPRETPGHIIVGINDRDAQYHDAYRVDLNTGERELLFENTENIAGWTTDKWGTLRFGIRITDDGGTEVLHLVDGQLNPVYDCSNEESCGPVHIHKDGRRVYMVTNKGNDIDLTRLTLFDPESRAEELVESDPENQVDFAGSVFSDVTDELMATVYVGDRVRIYPHTDHFAGLLERLRAKLPDGELGFSSSTSDETVFVVSVSRDVDPGSVYLYDAEADEAELLYRSRPQLPSEHLAFVTPVRYPARDGLEIPAYLTLPRGIEPQGLPTVIMPHGGPWARDMWGYDPYAQFLANRGYAVLQPNFRGSTGYGKAFLNAGNKQWGTGYMQHDISDGVKYLIEEGIADPNRVAIFGGSYGGYATLAGLAFTPDLYAAGISYVGPSNLLTLLASIPPYWAPVKRIFNVRLGNPDDPEDRKMLIEQSPLFSADSITAPLLVIQGANDPRVNQAESEQIVVALRDKGRDVEYMLAPDEGHGFAGRENRMAIAVAMERFFAEHIGGRYQESVRDDIAQRLAALTVDVNTVEVRVTEAAAAEMAATAPLPTVDSGTLTAGTFEYSTTLAVGGQEITVTSTRTLAPVTVDGHNAWRIVEQVSTPMGNQVDTLEVDRQSLLPARRSASGAGSVQLHYTTETISGEMNAGGQTIPVNVSLEAPIFGGGSGVEMAIAGLPLAEGYATTFRTFNMMTQKVRPFSLTVTGSEATDCAAGTFDTFVVELKPLDGDEAGTATMHVLHAAPHIVVQNITRLPAMMGGGTSTTELTSMKQSP